MANPPTMPRPIRPHQLAVLCDVNRAINDDYGTPREIYEARAPHKPGYTLNDFCYSMEILMGRGWLVPDRPLRFDTYLQLTPHAMWLLGEAPRPAGCYRTTASFIQQELMYETK